MRIKNKIAAALLGACLAAMPIKAENMPDKQIVRYVTHVQKYIEEKGYSVSISGISGAKDYVIGIDDTLHDNNGNLEPKINIMPTSDTLPLDRWLLLYDSYNEEDFKKLSNMGGMYYELMGNEGSISRMLDKYFPEKTTSLQKKISQASQNILNASPNPFNSQVHINYAVPNRQEVKLKIYDMLGRKVRSLESTIKEKGQHTLNWDARDDSGRQLVAGTYFVEMTAEDKNYFCKIKYLK